MKDAVLHELRLFGRSVLWLVVISGVTFGVIWSFQTMVVFVMAASAALAVWGVVTHGYWRETCLVSRPAPTPLPPADVDLRWEGRELGASARVPGDVLWTPVVPLVAVTCLAAAVTAADRWGLPTGLVFLGMIPQLGAALYVRRRHRLSIRPPADLRVTADGHVEVATTLDHPQTRVPLEPFHVLHRHRDGTVTVAFGDLAPRSRSVLRYVAGTGFDRPRWRRRVDGLSLLLVRAEPDVLPLDVTGRPAG